MHQSEPKTEVQSQDLPQDSNTDETQYPGLKIVLPIVLSVCGVSLLTSLVNSLHHITFYDSG